MPATIEELQGVVSSLSEVVKGLVGAIQAVHTAQTTAAASQAHPPEHQAVSSPTLRLPKLQLPTFRQDTKVQDDIGDFLDRFQEQTSQFPVTVRLLLLEQQCIEEWPRSVLSFCRGTEGFAEKPPEQQLKFNNDPVGFAVTPNIRLETVLSDQPRRIRNLQKYAATLTDFFLRIVSKQTTSVQLEDFINVLSVTNKNLPTQSVMAGIPPSNEPTDSELPPSCSTQEQTVFGLPAVANPRGALKERHILWTPIVSAGKKLPLPLDSCCLVSLVSRSHADHVASKYPQLKYQSLDEPVAVSVADVKSQLQAIGTMEIPIQWNNGKETTFQMLVVPGLSWLILFGENHLHST
ncbi:hypothetical protein ACROYT_G008176 [Oculina patagonica]